jgi:acyl-coenzyme A synthetase/AMP-(fatty) acid ligase
MILSKPQDTWWDPLKWKVLRHPAVEAAVGKPEPTIGELVKAFVVLKRKRSN